MQMRGFFLGDGAVGYRLVPFCDGEVKFCLVASGVVSVMLSSVGLSRGAVMFCWVTFCFGEVLSCYVRYRWCEVRCRGVLVKLRAVSFR